MMYDSETWAVKAEDEQRLVEAEKRMVRCMCGVTLSDRKMQPITSYSTFATKHTSAQN